MSEIWRDIKGYEDYYQVSNLGRVKSLDRVIMKRDGKRLSVREKILKSSRNSKGYYLVDLRKDYERNTQRVHRLVMSAFEGDSELEVNHKDGNKFNNSLDNLEYLSHVENVTHCHTVLRGRKRCGLYFHKQNKNWVARIKHLGKTKMLGSFKDKEDGYRAYYDAYLRLHGIPPW